MLSIKSIIFTSDGSSLAGSKRNRWRAICHNAIKSTRS